MKCKCSLNNNYEVIGLCDIGKFNQKIRQFADKSWTQIIIPEKLSIPDNKPSIKKINKVYLDIKITSTKVIKTPYSDMPNVEGLTLTGKLLLVSGEICQRIVYISETIYDIVCSVKFNIKFSTYIVVDENTDLENDFFCIYPCVEDVSVRPLTERVLSKSVTLFLFAHKTTKTPLPPMMLENAFIFNSSDPDEEMASVEFDKNNRKLVVNSTGLSYNLPGLREAYKFELIDSNGITIKNSSSVGGNENADVFRDTLDNTDFEFGDLIKLTFSSNLRLWLTNYPNPNSKYYMISDNVQGFKITQNGIIPYVLPNYIALDNSNSQRVLRIQFDIFSKSLLVVAISSNTTNAGTNTYFVATLYEADGRTQKQIASVPGNSNARNFATNFNNTRFQFGDILKISYEEANMVLITNFPTSATPIYSPTGKEKYFIITENGLMEFVRRIEKFPTNFVLKTSSDEEMAKIEFDKLNKELIITSTGIPYSNQPNRVAFEFELRDSNGNPKISATIENNENADNFKDTLSSEIFEFGDTIALFYSDSSKISLNNYPDLNDTYNMIGNNRAEEFVITQDGITPILTPTKITINSKNNEEVLSIQFVRSRQIFIVSSKGVVPNPSLTDPYLRFRLKDENGDDLVNANLNSNEDASSFKFQVNGKPFQYGQDSLTLIYKDKSKIKILNYPSDGDTYTPPDDFNVFQIIPNQLRNLALNNKITIINDNNEEMSSLYFIQPFAQPFVTITTTATSAISTNSGQPNEQYVQFLNYSERRPEFSSEILKRADASNFARALNNRPIEINEQQILRLSNRLSERVIITNYKGEIEYKVGEEPEFLEVTHNSFNPHNLNYDKIRFKNSDNSTILYIYFDKVSSRSIYIESYSTGVINNDTTSFTFKILDPDGIGVRIDKTITGGESGDVVQIDPPYNIFNQFDFGYLFTLEYSNPNLVEIFNFPFTDPPRNPTGTSQIFQIAQNGLVPISRLSINQITFRGFNGAKIAEVRFDTIRNTLTITSTGTMANRNFVQQEYFAFQLKASNGNVKNEASVKGNENADSFRNTLNNTPFIDGDIITLRFKEPDRVEIFNYPNISEVFEPQASTTIYSVKITQNSLEPILTPPIIGRLPNSFIFKTFDTNEEMAKVEFNTQKLTLIVTSTGKIYNNGTGTVFEFEILNSDGSTQAYDSITGDDNADSFTILNDSNFYY